MSDSKTANANDLLEPIQVKSHLPASLVIDWLHAGVEDIHHAGKASLFYGLVFTVVGILITQFFFAGNYWLLGGLTTGFLLLGPFSRHGVVYDLSRQIEQAQKPKLIPSLTAWWPNLFNMALFACILVLAFACLDAIVF